MPSLFESSLFELSLVRSSFLRLRPINIVFGVAAVSLALGAAQFASGHDLVAPPASAEPGAAVNRADKADRAAIAVSAARSRTIGFRPGDLPHTSVLVRIPLTTDARDAVRAPPPIKSGQSSKPMLACEPVVSVLTEVARKLQPGRCVT
jgi:hypothetical protein